MAWSCSISKAQRGFCFVPKSSNNLAQVSRILQTLHRLAHILHLASKEGWVIITVKTLNHMDMLRLSRIYRSGILSMAIIIIRWALSSLILRSSSVALTSIGNSSRTQLPSKTQELLRTPVQTDTTSSRWQQLNLQTAWILSKWSLKYLATQRNYLKDSRIWVSTQGKYPNM